VLIRNALLLPGAGDWRARRADIRIEGSLIAELGEPGTLAGEDLIDAGRLLAAPGLVNAHYHSPLSILRGTADGLSHPAFMWQNQVDTAGRTAREVYVSALLGGAEMLASGTTAVIDHFPEQGFALEHVEAVARAYRDLGMRAALALRVFDGRYDDILPAGGLPPALAGHNPLAVAPLEETMALVADAVKRFHEREGRIQVFPAPSNPSRCSDALLVACDELAVRHGLGVHTHLLETEIQTRIAQDRYGTTMVRHMDRLGLLSGKLSCAHTIWIDEQDIALLAERGATVVHNPESNLKVGAGVMPLPAMRRRGLRVALGTDGASTNDNLSLHEAMRLAAERDAIAAEYAGGFRVTFDLALARLRRALGRGLSLLDAIAHAHLELMARVPDTLIARKAGALAARAVAARARTVVRAGGLGTRKGLAAARRLDAALRKDGNRLNPGTSADLMAAALFVWLLEGPGRRRPAGGARRAASPGPEAPRRVP